MLPSLSRPHARLVIVLALIQVGVVVAGTVGVLSMSKVHAFEHYEYVDGLTWWTRMLAIPALLVPFLWTVLAVKVERWSCETVPRIGVLLLGVTLIILGLSAYVSTGATLLTYQGESLQSLGNSYPD